MSRLKLYNVKLFIQFMHILLGLWDVTQPDLASPTPYQFATLQMSIFHSILIVCSRLHRLIKACFSDSHIFNVAILFIQGNRARA